MPHAIGARTMGTVVVNMASDGQTVQEPEGDEGYVVSRA